jgi:uncharacterized protein (DUF924 family)
MSAIDDVLGFWIEPKPTNEEEIAERGKLWFGGGPELDATIRERFGALLSRAERGELDGWAAEPRGRLALIILLDQFSRNVHRGKPEAFANDPKALELARTAFDGGLYDAADAVDRLFASLPFSHAEDLEAQKRAVRISVQSFVAAPPHFRKFLVSATDFARKHIDVIARFGRFPHRNATLGRASTPEELEYLGYLKEAGQWL